MQEKDRRSKTDTNLEVDGSDMLTIKALVCRD